MQKKARISIKYIILIPVFILGIVSIFSNVEAIMNIRRVNTNATEITDTYMVRISELEKIQRETQNLHKLALSHIIATNLDTMIELVDSVHQEEEVVQNYLDDYQKYLTQEDQAAFEQLQADYKGMNYEIANLMAYSANSQNEAAYALANGAIADYSNSMQQQIDIMVESANVGSEEAKNQLTATYQAAIMRNTITITISIISLIAALFCVFYQIIRKLTITNKELNSIIKGIENGQGDLTRRVSILSNDEISDLGNGINTFMDKLQSIMKMIIENTTEMENVVSEVQESVKASNDSASDLSAVTEELAATMQEVGNSAGTINQNADSVRDEVDTIAEKSIGINDYSKEMMNNANQMESNARKNMEETGIKVKEILDVLNQAIEDSKSVDQVNSLTNDILSISSQTNLLALNASIEAARAGEQGKGFAVVADEIRNLADQTRQETENITTLIDDLSAETNGVVEKVQNSVSLSQVESDAAQTANDHFTGIQDYITELGGRVGKVSEHMQNLYESNNRIVDSVNTLSSTSEEISASAQDVAEASDKNVNLVNDFINDMTGILDNINSLKEYTHNEETE